MNCLRQGRLESAIMPLDETLSIMKTLDAVRAPWGLRYPGEQKKMRGKRRFSLTHRERPAKTATSRKKDKQRLKSELTT
jgi:hypothetical protein